MTRRYRLLACALISLAPLALCTATRAEGKWKIDISDLTMVQSSHPAVRVPQPGASGDEQVLRYDMFIPVVFEPMDAAADEADDRAVDNKAVENEAAENAMKELRASLGDVASYRVLEARKPAKGGALEPVEGRIVRVLSAKPNESGTITSVTVTVEWPPDRAGVQVEFLRDALGLEVGDEGGANTAIIAAPTGDDVTTLERNFDIDQTGTPWAIVASWKQKYGFGTGYTSDEFKARVPVLDPSKWNGQTGDYPISFTHYGLRMHGSLLHRYGAEIATQAAGLGGCRYAAYYELPAHWEGDVYWGLRAEYGGYAGSAGWFPKSGTAATLRAWAKVFYSPDPGRALGTAGSDDGKIRWWVGAWGWLDSANAPGYRFEARIFKPVSKDARLFAQAEYGDSGPNSPRATDRLRLNAGIETGF